MSKHRGLTIVNRLNDIVATVDIGVTYNLHIGGTVTNTTLHHDSSHILIDISRQNSLNHKHMVIAFHHFHHTQVIYVSIVIKIQIRKHILRGVKHHLKLLNRRSLPESSTYGAQIQIKRNIVGSGINLHRSGGSRNLLLRDIYRSRCSHHRFGSNCHNTRQKATIQHKRR